MTLVWWMEGSRAAASPGSRAAVEASDAKLLGFGLFMALMGWFWLKFWDSPLGIWISRRSMLGNRVSNAKGERYRRSQRFGPIVMLVIGVVMFTWGAGALLLSLF